MSYLLQQYLTPPQLTKHYEVLQFLRHHPNKEFSLAELDEHLPYGASVLRFPPEWIRFMEAGECGNKNVELLYRGGPTVEKDGRHIKPHSLLDSATDEEEIEDEEPEIILICRRPLIRTVHDLAALLEPPSSQLDRDACIGVHTDQVILAPGVLEEAQRQGVAFYFPSSGTAGNSSVDGLFGGYARPESYASRSTTGGGTSSWPRVKGVGSPAAKGPSTRTPSFGASPTSTTASPTLEEELQEGWPESSDGAAADVVSGGIPMAFLRLPPGVLLRCRLYTVRGVAVEDQLGIPTRWQLGERLVLLLDNHRAVMEVQNRKWPSQKDKVQQEGEEEGRRDRVHHRGAEVGGGERRCGPQADEPFSTPLPLRVHFRWGGEGDMDEGQPFSSVCTSSISFSSRQPPDKVRSSSSSSWSSLPTVHDGLSTSSSAGHVSPTSPMSFLPARIRQRTMLVPVLPMSSSPSVPASSPTGTSWTTTSSPSSPRSVRPKQSGPFFTRVRVDIEPLQKGDFKLIFLIDTHPLKNGQVTHEVEERVLDIHIDGPHTSLPGVLIGRERQPSGIDLYTSSSPFIPVLLHDALLLSGNPLPPSSSPSPSSAKRIEDGKHERDGKGEVDHNVKTVGEERGMEHTEGITMKGEERGDSASSSPSAPLHLSAALRSALHSSQATGIQLLPWWQSPSPLVSLVRDYAIPPRHVLDIATEAVFSSSSRELASRLLQARQLVQRRRRATEDALSGFGASASRRRRRMEGRGRGGGRGKLLLSGSSDGNLTSSSSFNRFQPELCNTHILFYGIDLSVAYDSSSPPS